MRRHEKQNGEMPLPAAKRRAHIIMNEAPCVLYGPQTRNRWLCCADVRLLEDAVGVADHAVALAFDITDGDVDALIPHSLIPISNFPPRAKFTDFRVKDTALSILQE